MRIIRPLSISLSALLTSTAVTQLHAQQVLLPTLEVESPIVRPPAPNTGAQAESQPGLLTVVPDAYAPVTVVKRQDLDLQLPRSLGEALGDKPGITNSSFAPGAASRPVIRGLDNFRVRIQENGVNASDVSSLGEDHAVPVDPLAAEQIEVIRGPATLRYGSQAIGGVVSATNNRIPMFIPPNGFSASTTTGFSSVDRGFEQSTKMDVGSGNVAVHGDVYTRKAQDYRIPGGTQGNSAVAAGGASVGASYFFENGYMGLAYTHFDSTYHVPGGEAADTKTRIHMVQDKLTAKGEIRPASSFIEAIRFWAGTSYYHHDEIGLNEDGVDATRATFINREQEIRVEAQHTPARLPFGTLSGAAGIQYGRRFIGTSGEAGGLLAPSQRSAVAAYLFEELKLTDTLKMQGAVRAEHVDASGTAAMFPSNYLPPPDVPSEMAQRRSFAPMSASLGLLKQLPWDLIATLNASYVQRAPDTPELYSKGSHDAPGTFEIGNPNLKLEVAKTIEIGLKRAVGPFRFDASGYYTKYNGFIYKRLTGVICDDTFASCGTGTDFQQIVYSQADATFYGAELAAQYDVLPLWKGTLGVDGQYDFVRAKFADDTNVPRIPPHRLGGGVYYRDDNWFARVGLLHAFAHNEIAPNETPTAGYDNLTARLSYRVKTPSYAFKELEVGLAGDNLLNADIRNSVSFKKDEILLPGRSVRAHMTMRF